MNHYADIEEGLDTFDDEQERSEAEGVFRDNPEFIKVVYGEDSDLTFTATAVQIIHLRGDRKPGLEPPKWGSPAPSIFDYSEGCLVARGHVILPRGINLGDHVLEIRWSNFGKEQQVTHP